LRKTQITKLPESIGKLKKLMKLHLDGNVPDVPDSFLELPDNLQIYILHNGQYRPPLNKREFWFKYKLNRKMYRINNTTNFFNKNISPSSMRHIDPNKRAFLKIAGEVKKNGTLRRVYNMNFFKSYPRGKLFSGPFEKENITLLKNVKHVVNKSAYIKNISNHLSNVSLNIFNKTVKNLKTKLPSNVSRTDVNSIVRNMKPKILNKIYNKLKNSPSNNRVRIMNSMKTRGLMNNADIVNMKKRFSL